MSSVLIRNARLVNEGLEFEGNLLVGNGRIVNTSRRPGSASRPKCACTTCCSMIGT